MVEWGMNRINGIMNRRMNTKYSVVNLVNTIIL